MATTTRKKKFTVEESAAYREAQRDLRKTMIREAATALLSTEGWQRWVRFRSRVNRYSWLNLALIVQQLPEASIVMKYPDWQEMGRNVVKGERALRIWAPLFRKPTGEEIAAGHPADKKILYCFKSVPVFDVSQTDGDELPDAPSVEPITGDSHERFIKPLVKLAAEAGYTVEEKPVSELHGAGGYCDSKRKLVVINEADAPNAKVRVLVHEIAHALGIDYLTHTREQAEVLVETVTYIVCGGIGLDTGSESIPYVAGWGQADQIEAVTKFANDLDTVARRIENALA